MIRCQTHTFHNLIRSHIRKSNKCVKSVRPAPRSHALLVLAFALILTACRTSDGLRRAYLERTAAMLAVPATPVVIIPGFGVSRLYDPEEGRFVWGTPRNVVRIRYRDDLDLPIGPGGEFARDTLVASGFAGSRGPINTAWQLGYALRRFGRYEESDAPRTLYRFAYDWRLSAAENARELDAFIDRIREEHAAPTMKVDLVAHSAGGVVVLTYLRIGAAGLGHAERWNEGAAAAAAKVRKVVLIAPPQRGVADAFRVVVQPERFIRRTFHPETVLTWPAVTELLPFDGAVVADRSGRTLPADLRTIEGWELLKAGPFDPTVRSRIESNSDFDEILAAFTRSLERAKLFREMMGRPLPPDIRLQVLGGDCVATARRVLRRDDGRFVFYASELREEEMPVRDVLFERGDGTVPVSSSLADRYFCDGHQGLAMDPNLHRELIRTLVP